MIEVQRSSLPENGLALRQELHVHEFIVSYSIRAPISLLEIFIADLSWIRCMPISSDMELRIPFKV